jgi:hypothetical protein
VTDSPVAASGSSSVGALSPTASIVSQAIRLECSW